jgi:hypothetical protein
MSDFTTLFAETLNATIAKMVDAAMLTKSAEIAFLEERVIKLESQVADLTIESAKMLDNMQDEDAISSIVEQAIENYDFTSIVKQAVDTDDLFERREFDDAVRDVIASALRR